MTQKIGAWLPILVSFCETIFSIACVSVVVAKVHQIQAVQPS